MARSDDRNLSKTLVPFLRRTQSVDINGPEIILEASEETLDSQMNGTLSSGYHPLAKQNDDSFIYSGAPGKKNRRCSRTLWRTRSVFAPSPECNFGPKGTLKNVQNNEQLIVIQDPSNQRLHWISPPNSILIIRKPGASTLQQFRILVEKLVQRELDVYIEKSDYVHLPIDRKPELNQYIGQFHCFDPNDSSKIDLIICLGGDGTLLHVSTIFQTSCPPVLSFSMGSLGFLTPFDFENHEKILNEILAGNIPILLRSRLKCTIVREGSNVTKKSNSTNLSPINFESITNNTIADHLVLNEVVVDRGPNSYLSNLDLYINDRFITKVQGDGLIISTPTGSTAYAMAAGASMVHPNVPAIIICPVCPHSLSFRPIVVPAGIELTLKVSHDSRLTAWLSIDGRNRHELNQQESIKITTTVYPIPSICRFDQLGDWFESLANILHWNLRRPQLNLDTDRSVPIEDNIETSQDDENSLSKI